PLHRPLSPRAAVRQRRRPPLTDRRLPRRQRFGAGGRRQSPISAVAGQDRAPVQRGRDRRPRDEEKARPPPGPVARRRGCCCACCSCDCPSCDCPSCGRPCCARPCCGRPCCARPCCGRPCCARPCCGRRCCCCGCGARAGADEWNACAVIT